jgi:hypothetical protein
MNSNTFNYRKYLNSEFFHLVPSTFVTFGQNSSKKSNSEISDNFSNKRGASFAKFPSSSSNDFGYEMNNDISNHERNSIKFDELNESSYNEIIKKKKGNNKYYKIFKIGSNTVLSKLNTCLLNLFIQGNEGKSLNEFNSSQGNFCSGSNENNANNFIQSKIKISPVKNGKDENFLLTKKIKGNEGVQSATYPKSAHPILTNKNSPTNNYFNSINKSRIENPAKNNKNNFDEVTKKIFLPHLLKNNVTKISNITNVTNNYFFNYNGNLDFLKKKTKRPNDALEYSIKKEKNIKKDDHLYGLYQLNQISVNGHSISKFPVVSMKEEDLEVQISTKMLNEANYFSIVNKYYINIPVLEEEKYNKPLYDKVFKKEKEKISNLYLIEDNIIENNPVKLIRNYYHQIKSKILNIQNNYISNNKKSINFNKDLCKELEKLIISCNAITNTVTDYKKSGLKRKLFTEQQTAEENNKNNFTVSKDDKDSNLYNNNIINSDNKNSSENNTMENSKKKQKKNHFKTYLCEFCNKAYSNGQGLGGHMSRIHPNQSYKYKDKIRIRREREKKREKLLNVKKYLFKKYGFDYNKLLDGKNKNFIQKFLTEHNEEYVNLRKNQQKIDKNKENINQNEEDKKNEIRNMNIFTLPQIINNNIEQ